jgi:hypothetical protein
MIFSLMGLSSITIWFLYERWKYVREREAFKTQTFGSLRGRGPGTAPLSLRVRWEAFRRQADYWARELWSQIRDRVRGRTKPVIVVTAPDGEVGGGDLALDVEKKLEDGGGATLPLASSNGKRLWASAYKKASVASKHVTPAPSKPSIGPTLAWETAFVQFASSSSDSGQVRVSEVPKYRQYFRQMHFSSNGEWLAVISKYGCSLFRMRDVLRPDSGSTSHLGVRQGAGKRGLKGRLEPTQVLKHRHNEARQTEWSPNGRGLLTRASMGLRVWGWIEGPDGSEVRFFAFNPNWVDVNAGLATDNGRSETD